MIQLFLTIIGGYLIGNSMKPKTFANGGEVGVLDAFRTVKNCLIAQNYSDAAKGIEIYPHELNYRQIEAIRDNSMLGYEGMVQKLYDCKSDYIQKAIKSAKGEKVPVFYCSNENCIYFEFPFGQVSFHIDEWRVNYPNVNKVEGYKWSGLTNSRDLLVENYKYEQGGLIAPNGKKSNLTPEQWHLVRTPKFKAWFGDWENDAENGMQPRSMVADYVQIWNPYSVRESTGEPIVVYHASNSDFNIFDLDKANQREQGWFGMGFYFGESEIQVQQYGKIIKPYFLKLLKPFQYAGSPREFANQFDLEYSKNKDFAKIVRDKIISYGWDSVIIDSTYGTEYVAFYPEQIKLADGTNTTFDGDNPDIRYNNGGILNAKKIEEIINTFYIAVGKHYKENMFSNESRSAKQRLNFANKKLNKILGFEFGKISEHTEKQKAVYNSLYELTNLIGESTGKPYDTPKELSEAYQKAILDGGNPELVNTVNKVLLNSNLK